MPPTNSKDMHPEEFLLPMRGRIRRVWNAARQAVILSSFLGLGLLLACSFGCAPSSQSDGKQNDSAPASNDIPEITEEMIRERINGTRVRKVPEENAAAEPIGWTFDEDEPKEIGIVEKQINGIRATVVLDIKTSSAKYSRDQRSLAGKIRIDWELQTGWMLRKWEIVNIENISMKYKNLPKPSAQNSNH